MESRFDLITFGSDTMLEMGLRPNSTEKLAQELRFFLTFINDPCPQYPSNVKLPACPLTCDGWISKLTRATNGRQWATANWVKF